MGSRVNVRLPGALSLDCAATTGCSVLLLKQDLSRDGAGEVWDFGCKGSFNGYDPCLTFLRDSSPNFGLSLQILMTGASQGLPLLFSVPQLIPGGPSSFV